VQCPAATVQADGNAVCLEHARKTVTDELATLIGVEDLRFTISPSVSCKQPAQNDVSGVLQILKLSTFLLYQSITAAW